MDITRGFIIAKVPSKDQTHVRMIATTDPHLQSIPQTLINFMVKTIFPKLIRAIFERGNKLPETYDKLIEEKAESYNALFEKIFDLCPTLP